MHGWQGMDNMGRCQQEQVMISIIWQYLVRNVHDILIIRKKPRWLDCTFDYYFSLVLQPSCSIFLPEIYEYLQPCVVTKWWHEDWWSMPELHSSRWSHSPTSWIQHSLDVSGLCRTDSGILGSVWQWISGELWTCDIFLTSGDQSNFYQVILKPCPIWRAIEFLYGSTVYF